MWIKVDYSQEIQVNTNEFVLIQVDGSDFNWIKWIQIDFS